MLEVKACTIFPSTSTSSIKNSNNLLFLPLKTQKKYPTIQDNFPFFYSITPVIKKRWADLHWCVSFKPSGFHHCLPVLFWNNHSSWVNILKSVTLQCTVIFFASCLSGGFINATAVKPPERKNWQNTPLCSALQIYPL